MEEENTRIGEHGGHCGNLEQWKSMTVILVMKDMEPEIAIIYSQERFLIVERGHKLQHVLPAKMCWGNDGSGQPMD